MQPSTASQHAGGATPPGPRLDEATRVEASPDVVSVAQAGRTILLDTRAGRYYALDGVGGAIWEMLERGGTVGEIDDYLAREYAAPREKLEADLRRLLADLRASGLVTCTS
jgi:hypothetical protein